MNGTTRSGLYLSTFTAALGGLLFGFDTAVISGAVVTLEGVFGLNGFWLGFVVAAALLGTIGGTLVAAASGERLGRRGTLMAAALLYLVSVAGSASAHVVGVLIAFRFLGGLALGAASVVAPMYIAEISPARLRGRLVAVNQLNLVTGILLGYLSNFLLASWVGGVDAWRWMLAVEAIPAAVFLLLLRRVPESPLWLAARGRGSEIPRASPPDARLFQRRHARPIFLGATVALLNQLSGVNAVLFFAPRVFRMAGAGEADALLQAATIGGTNLVFTVVGLLLIDRAGRRPLLMIGGAGAAASLALTALGVAGAGSGGVVLAGLLGFVAFHAIGQGAVIWVFISEVFPARVRGKGQALGSFTHWAAAAVVSWSFPALVASSAAPVFAFFSLMMVVQILFAWKLMPETRGLSLEEVERRLSALSSARPGAPAAVPTGRRSRERQSRQERVA